MKRKILWFTRKPISIKTNGLLFGLQNPNAPHYASKEMQHIIKTSFNTELDVFTHAFQRHSRWECYWTCMDFVDSANHKIKIYHPESETYLDIELDTLDDYADFILFKYLGAVESQRDKIRNCLHTLETHFTGAIINHPESIRYFIRKDYYLELEKAGFPVIPNSKIYPQTVRYATILNDLPPHKKPEDYIIKPVTGELGNSLGLLNQLGQPRKPEHIPMTPEEWLRLKEPKVGGWIVQEYHKEVWNGEYRLVFLGNVCVLGLRKRYYKMNDHQIIPNEKYRIFDLYEPTDHELKLGKDLKKYWEEVHQKPIYFFRLDFIKTKDALPKISILEFEAVNPGFSLGALTAAKQQEVANQLVNYLDNHSFL